MEGPTTAAAAAGAFAFALNFGSDFGVADAEDGCGDGGGTVTVVAGAFPFLDGDVEGVAVEGKFSIKFRSSPTSSLLTPVVLSSSCKFAWTKMARKAGRSGWVGEQECGFMGESKINIDISSPKIIYKHICMFIDMSTNACNVSSVWQKRKQRRWFEASI